MQFRKMKPSETEGVRSLLLDAYSFDYDLNPGYKADILDMEGRADTCETWVLEDEGELVACVCTPFAGKKFAGEEMNSLSRPGELTFRLLAVSPKHRRKGYGKTMIQAVNDLAKKRKYNTLMLVTGPEMETAQKLYRALDFEQPKERETYIPEFDVTLLTFLKPVV